MIAAALLALVLLTLLMALAWWVQHRVGNAGWVDVFWTFGTGAASVALALPAFGGAPLGRRLLLAALAAAWSVRLGTYVAIRVAGLGREDVRYVAFRREWGTDFPRRMFRFVIVQGPIACLLAASVMLAAHARAPFPAVADVAGAAVSLCGFAVETVADRQMRAFRADAGSEGRVCDRGLWSRTRHPNYLGEFLVWCGVPVIAIGAGGPWPGLLALAAPAMMYGLLAHVSGIPPLEQAMLASRGEAYRDYQRRVPAFFPSLSGRRR